MYDDAVADPCANDGNGTPIDAARFHGKNEVNEACMRIIQEYSDRQNAARAHMLTTVPGAGPHQVTSTFTPAMVTTMNQYNADCGQEAI